MDVDATGGFVITEDDSDLFQVLPGRRSFGGFNKSVEKYYHEVFDEQRLQKLGDKAKNNTISDEEMLKRYENLIGLPRGPNQGVRPDHRAIKCNPNSLHMNNQMIKIEGSTNKLPNSISNNNGNHNKRKEKNSNTFHDNKRHKKR